MVGPTVSVFARIGSVPLVAMTDYGSDLLWPGSPVAHSSIPRRSEGVIIAQ